MYSEGGHSRGDATLHDAKESVIKGLYPHCFAIEQIQEGMEIPVGGHLLHDELEESLIVDSAKFEDFFVQLREVEGKQDEAKIKDSLDKAGISIEVNLFIKLAVFAAVFDKYKKENAINNTPEKAQKRFEMYVKGKAVNLSDIFKEAAPECAEIAALAQLSLQEKGLNSRYVTGAVIWEQDLSGKDEAWSEPHSFISLKFGGKSYIFDSANPINSQDESLPSIYEMTHDFMTAVSQRKKKFVKGRNVLTGQEAYFGVDNGTNVWPQRDVLI